VGLSEGLVDTSVFVAAERGANLDPILPEVVVVSVITVGELIAGVLAAADASTRAARLATLSLAQRFDPIDVDQDVAAAWARLRTELVARQRRMPVNDSWIAATAMALRIPVVTLDDDYVEVPGLTVIRG
jgi:predicted nucleic acid-binding protein